MTSRVLDLRLFPLTGPTTESFAAHLRGQHPALSEADVTALSTQCELCGRPMGRHTRHGRRACANQPDQALYLRFMEVLRK